jgi:hypothetical protein
MELSQKYTSNFIGETFTHHSIKEFYFIIANGGDSSARKESDNPPIVKKAQDWIMDFAN